MENLSKAYEVLQQIISEDGYPVKKFRLHAKYPSVVKISSPDRDTIEIDFIDSKPKVKVKKLFTISITVLGITLKKNNGVIKLDGFPDVSFSYDEV